MKVLVACEESKTVCKAFREKGHEAYSCDIQEPSGGHPEWHILGDVIPLINGRCEFTTMDGVKHSVGGKWDMIIAHPPCTYLTVTANRWYDVNKYGDAAKQRMTNRFKAIVFFMRFILADCDRICVENPVGIMGTAYEKATQIIQPYWFGHPARKSTCLWLKGLPKLKHTNIVQPDIVEYTCKSGKKITVSADYGVGFNTQHGRRRSKTYDGIAGAMADQWG